MPLVSRTFNQLIDFTRASSATYVDATGKIVPTAQSRNLLTYTQEFDNAAWIKTNTTVTANSTTAPDGTLTADTVAAGAGAGGGQQIYQALTTIGSGQFVYSIYVKQGSGATDSNQFAVYNQTAAVDYARITVNYTTGVVTQIVGSGATMTAAGNGWWRISMPFTSAATLGNAVRFFVGSSGGVETPGEFIYVWGAQLEAVPDANLVLGSELWANQAATISNSAGGAVYTYTSATQELDVTTAGTDGGYPRQRYDLGLVTGKFYRIEGRIDGVRSGAAIVRLALSGSANNLSYNSTTGVISGYAVAANALLEIVHNGTIAGARTLATISVKEITGTTGMPTDYTRNVGGLFPPRFDYDPVTLAPKGLLVEEQRTNLLTYSEQFDNAAWTKGGATVAANAVASPDGTVDADTLVEDTSTGPHRVYQAPSCSANTTYTFTVYVKAAGRTQVRVLETSRGGADFDLSAVAVGAFDSGVTASIQDAGGGWYRCRITTTTGAAQTIFVTQIQAISGGTNSYTGNGAAALHLWGAQLEAGAFATSYIPTVASQVTRSADGATITGANFSQWYNQSAGTFVVEIGSFSSTSTRSATLIAATDNPAADDWILMEGNASGVSATYRNAGVNQAALSPAGAIPSGGKMAFAYAANDFAACVSGGTVSTDTSGTLSSDVTVLRIGAFGTNPTQLNGHIRSVRFYPTRLANAQLQALTA